MSTLSRKRVYLGLLVAAIALLFGVPLNATIVDLTTAGSSGSITAGTDFFQQIQPRATGTGLIDPFVRMQTPNTIEEGFNTDGNPKPLNDLSGQFTHSILLSDIPVINIGGVNYLQFMLDINQTGASPLLSLSEVKIFSASTGNITAFTGTNSTFNLTGGTLKYDMDAGNTANGVQLNYSLNTGSGSGDMFMYVAQSLFSGLSANTYIYLYSLFGQPSSNNDGFEEWALNHGAPVVPEPASVVLFGTVLAGLGLWLRRRVENNA